MAEQRGAGMTKVTEDWAARRDAMHKSLRVAQYRDYFFLVSYRVWALSLSNS